MKFLKIDIILTLLFLNALSVIIGYAAAVGTTGASVGTAKILKQGLLGVSLIIVGTQKDLKNSFSSIINYRLVFFLITILPFFSILSTNYLQALNQTQTFIIPLLYVMLSTSLLLYRYGQLTILKYFANIVLIIYSFPVASYLFFGRDLSGKTIYVGQGSNETIFFSNQFGWSGTLVLVSSLTFLYFNKIKRYQTFLLGLICLLSLYLVVVSTNRTSMLALSIVIFLLIIRNKILTIFQKLLLLLVPVALFFYFQTIENSAIDFLINRTKYQQEVTGEGRVEVTSHVLTKFEKNPTLWLLGAGIFDYSILKSDAKDFGGYHNSYWELLFGLGIPLFLLFMKFMLYDPLKQFIFRVSKFDLLFIPLAIIPLFESNLTGGQFVFFPWFIYIFMLNCKEKYFYYGVRNRPN